MQNATEGTWGGFSQHESDIRFRSTKSWKNQLMVYHTQPKIGL